MSAPEADVTRCFVSMIGKFSPYRGGQTCIDAPVSSMTLAVIVVRRPQCGRSSVLLYLAHVALACVLEVILLENVRVPQGIDSLDIAEDSRL